MAYSLLSPRLACSYQERGTAYSYVAQIKDRFKTEPVIYRDFLNILQVGMLVWGCKGAT